jgi:solute carrier family 25 (mitochondrial carrier protein), member 16
VIRVRLAFETKRDSSSSSLLRICKQIYHEQPPPIATPAKSAVPGVGVIEQAAPRSGLINFYRGFLPTLLGMLPYAGMSFLTHDTIGDLLRHPSIAQYTVLPSTALMGRIGRDGPRRAQLTAPAELTSGAIAGLVSQTASYPFEVIRRRMQVGGAVGDGHRLRVAETARMIWMERGWQGFFIGLTIGYVKVVPMVAVSFYVYERGKWWLGIDS